MGASSPPTIAIPRQLGLFSGGGPMVSCPLHPQRVELGGGSWLEYQPSWLSGDDTLFDRLMLSSVWRRHERPMYERIVAVPRLTSHVALNALDAPEPHRLLARLSRLLSDHYGRTLTSASLTLYRNGQDSVAPHGDKLGPLIDDSVLAIVSLGGPRRMLITRNRDSMSQGISAQPERLTFHLGGGDLLVMGGSCQRTHRHSIPKVAKANPRISIVFREPLPGVQSEWEPAWMAAAPGLPPGGP